jgi:hypothetical protein
MHESHRFDDRRLTHQDRLVDQAVHVAKRVVDRHAHRDAVSDGA